MVTHGAFEVVTDVDVEVVTHVALNLYVRQTLCVTLRGLRGRGRVVVADTQQRRNAEAGQRTTGSIERKTQRQPGSEGVGRLEFAVRTAQYTPDAVAADPVSGSSLPSISVGSMFFDS